MDRHIVIDQTLFRPAEVDVVNGNARTARAKLGWEPTISLEEMIREMVEVDLERIASS